MLHKFDITFGRELTEKEIDDITCYLDENITDNWVAIIAPEKEPSERENRETVRWLRRKLRQLEKEQLTQMEKVEPRYKLETPLKSKIISFFRHGG